MSSPWIESSEWLRVRRAGPFFALGLLLVVCFAGCAKKNTTQTPRTSPPVSQVRVTTGADRIVLNTQSAEFAVNTRGYVAANLLADTHKLSLDDAGSENAIDLIASGKHVRDIVFDLARATISDAHGKLGTRGQRVEIAGKSESAGLGVSLVRSEERRVGK